MPSKFGFESEPTKSDMEKRAELERRASEEAEKRFEKQHGEEVGNILRDFLATHSKSLELVKESSVARWHAGEKTVRTGYGFNAEPGHPLRAYYTGHNNTLVVRIAGIAISDTQAEKLSSVLYNRLGINVEVTTFGTAGPRQQGIFRYPYLIGR